MPLTPRIIGAGLVVASLAACSSLPEQGTPEDPSPDKAFASDARDDVPAGPADIRTTSPEIYIGNLNARATSLEQGAARRSSPRFDLMLAETLAHRARVLGKADDRSTALELATSVLEREPDHARALLLRARLLSSVHRFEEALRDLDRAAAVGAARDRTARQRAETLLALGRVDEAMEAARPHLGDDLSDLAFRANRHIDRGNPERADELFTRAQESYQDSNPYPLAWLHVQHGVLFLRSDDLERARVFFAAAHERLPGYYLATEHLAETLGLLGETRRSAELYRQVSEQTEDPVFLAALADAERELGNGQAATEAEQAARKGFREWLDREPAAAWQHAAEFYLDRGEMDRALEYARQNADLRQNVGSLLLLARAEKAAGNAGNACRAWQRAHDSGLNPPEFKTLRSEFEDC